MSSVKEGSKDIENLKEVREELTDERNSRSDICTHSDNNLEKDSFDSYLTDSHPGAQDCNNKGQNSFDIDKNCIQNTVIKSEENGAHSKTEKRRNVSLLKNEPPPLIHYLQDKEAPKIDDDNSPPQLLPEVIVTRTKLHREKSQTFNSQTENSFKVSVARNLQKSKRKLWMKYSSLSDDQTSNESHEHFLSYADISQCSSTASGILKKGTAGTPEKQRKSKQSNHCEKSQRMGISPESARILPKFPSCNGTSCFSSDGEPQERIVEKSRPASSESGVEEFERERSIDLRNEVDYESWLTETEDEEEDDAIFVVPPQISTGKEERDRIDGIEFLGFETEHDMVEFTKIELDYRGECQQNEENITHSDDGLDMMDDSFHYSEPEAHSGSQAIIPTKTKDITKIKGWRTKTFAINNNPSEGQCSSSSIGPYEDDDGFVSCDIKIEEDASLDMEEQEDLWSGGEQDLFTHDAHLPIESYTEDSVKKEFPSSIKTERKSMEGDATFSGFEDQTHDIKNDNVQFENRTYGTGRYPKRMSTTLNKVTSAVKKEADHIPSKQTDLPYKVPKKRGRKPKTIAEKRLMLQLANQYKRRRKRGRPKGSGKKSNKLFKQQKDSNVSEVVYNLRNKSKREEHISDKSNGLNSSAETNNSVRNMEIVEETEHLNDKKGEFVKSKVNSKLQFGQRRYLLASEMKIQDEDEDSYTYFSSLKNSLEEKIGIIDSSKQLLKEGALITSNITPISTSDTLTTSSTATSLPASRSSYSDSLISPSNKIKFASDIQSSEISIASTLASGGSSSTNTRSLIPSSSGAITTTTNSVAITTAELPTISSGGEASNWKNIYENGKIKQSHPCNLSLLDRSLDKSFEYGLILSTGIRRPLVTLAMDQLKTLRENNHHVDEHWAKFAASIVVTKTTKTSLQSNTVILPVRALRLPFMSFTQKPVSKDPYKPFSVITRPQNIVPKFDPMTGTSVRVRCPRPLTQVGVRTIPSIFKRQNLEHDYNILGVKRPRRSTMIDNEQRNQHVGSVENNFLKYEIDDEIRKVVEDLVDYVERREARDVVIHEEPRSHSLASESSNVNENIVLKRKKGPMIRELTRLDVNVIEMWDARNKKCTEEYCKLGCVCESLECCKPAIEQHCGKEECMFTCECEPKSYKRGDSRQHTLLSPLTLLTIPQQNRRVLAKEEKEFQQTVIRAKHETIVVGSNGSGRRKREIKLPGRYRDSYVALGKDYGLVDFKISSDENIDPSARRLTRIAVVNNRELIQGIPPKTSSGVSKVPWEVKVSEMKLQYGLKECFVKLKRSDCELIIAQQKENEMHIENSREEEQTKSNSQEEKSRNMAVKSTTLLPNVWYDPKYFAARTAPINTKLLKRFKPRGLGVNQNNLLVTSNSIACTVPSPAEVPPNVSYLSQNISMPSTSDFMLDDGPLSFGKIESVTTLSEEQFQKGDLTFGIQQFQTQSVSATIDEMKANTSDKTVKGKMNSNISIDKIANLLNRKIRELKEKGGNVSFPSGNEESIHLLQWGVLKNLFQSRSIQLWYYNGGSKLVITSTKLRPDPSFVNLNDVSEQQYKQLPPIISDLFKSDGRKNKQFHRDDIYALLHFDGKDVELVGTIFKNRSSSEVSHAAAPKNVKLIESKPDLNTDKLCTKASERKPTVDVPSLPSPGKCFLLKKAEINSLPKQSFTNQICSEQGKSHLIIKSSNVNSIGLVHDNSTEKQKPVSVVKSSSINMKSVGHCSQSQSLKEGPFSETKTCKESTSMGHKKITDNENLFSHNKSAINLNSQGLSEKEKPHLTVNMNGNSPRYVNERHEEKEKHLLIMKSSNLNNSSNVVRKTNEKEKQLSVVTSLNEQMGSQELGNQKHCEKEKLVSNNSNLNSPVPKSQNHIEKEKCTFATKSSILNTVLPETVKQVEKSPTSVKKLLNLNLQSLSRNQISKTSNATCAQSQLSATKCDGKSGTRIRKLKTVWQSTKVQTAEGENVPIPLPSCAGDSRWFVLHVSEPFDVLHITSKDCSARYKHISETIKMASSHMKTVRLPLQVSSKNSVCENPNQPKFGIYAVPHISSYVFIGPYGINEDPSITKSIYSDGKYRIIIDLDDDGDEPPTTNKNLGQDYSEKVVNILRKLCKRPVDKQKEIHSWLYTKRNCENEVSKVQKENSLPKNNAKNSPEKTNVNDNNVSLLKMGTCHNNIHINDMEVHVTTIDKGASTLSKDNAEIEKERSTVMKNTDSQSNAAKPENSNKIKNRMGSFKVSATGKVPQIPGSSQGQEISVKGTSPKKKTIDVCGEIAKKLNLNCDKSISYETNKADKFNRNSKLPNSSQLTSTPNLSSSTKSPSPKKKTIASTSSSSSKIQVSPSPQKNGHSKKTLLMGDSQKSLQPQPVAGWLVPSFLWIGCIPCNYEEGGGLFFSHPVSGVKMMFSNLESTQLWLDRLFQSAILYVPKHLFVTWTLLPTLGKDGLKQFDSSLLNGNYMMTMKGIFDIDKLVATDAESYGLKPIEVLRLQDKKCRRDLELGLYQLKRALDDNDGALLSQNLSKQDIILKAVAEIQCLQNNARNLEKERKKWKNSKHKSLLYLYNKMKGLPINKKRDIVQKLKIQYDQAEDKSRSPASDVKDPNDGLNFSMARYCGGAVIFPHKSDDSDLEDYLSEYDEEDLEDNCEDVTGNRKNIGSNNSSPRGESGKQSANIETTKYTVDNKINLRTMDDEYDDDVEDDDESVSISVVTSQNVTEVKDIINSDEITVTCLNNSSDVKNSLCASTSVQSRDSLMNKNENMSTSNTNFRSSPKITLKPLSALTSPVKIIASEEVTNSPPYTIAVKRKLMESNYDSAPDLPKKMKVHIPGETSQLNSGFDGSLLKKYKTIKIDSSVTQGNNSQTKMAAAGSITENMQVSTSSPKVTNPNTLYVNVVSPSQSKIVPLRVNDKVKGCVQNFGAVHVPSSTSLPNRTLKIIQKDLKPVYVQGPHRTLPILVTSHPSTVVPTSRSMLSSNAVQPSLPVLSVKKVTKDSIPPGVEPRPATFLPPPLIPITDKKQSKLLSEHTTQLLTAIAPLPTLIKMVDGMPAEKGS